MKSLLLSVFAIALAAPIAAQSLQPLPVEIVTAEERPFQFTVQMAGTIRAVNTVELGFRQGGRVTEILVDEGDQVQPGTVLARVDPLQQDEAFRVAHANLAAAIASEDQARQADQRAAAMLERGIGTRAARDATMQALSAAEGAVQQARSAVEQAQRAVNDTTLRAPAEAVVTARTISPGQLVGAAQPAFSLAALDGMEAVFQVADHPMLIDTVGARIELRTINVPRPPMTGVVSEIAPLVSPETGTVTVRARIEGESDVNLLGAAVEADLILTGDTGIALPWTALMRQGNQPAVWTVGDDGRVTLREVQINGFASSVVFLSGGVTPGQRVVAAGSQMLFPGRAVEQVEVVR